MIADQIAEESTLPRRVEQAQSNFVAARSKVTELKQQARTLIRQRPVVAVLAAVGVGYVAGRLVSGAMRWAP